MDINRKIKGIKKMIQNGVYIDSADVMLLINEIELQEKIINLMAKDLKTPVHNEEWIKKYYQKEVRK